MICIKETQQNFIEHSSVSDKRGRVGVWGILSDHARQCYVTSLLEAGDHTRGKRRSRRWYRRDEGRVSARSMGDVSEFTEEGSDSALSFALTLALALKDGFWDYTLKSWGWQAVAKYVCHILSYFVIHFVIHFCCSQKVAHLSEITVGGNSQFCHQAEIPSSLPSRCHHPLFDIIDAMPPSIVTGHSDGFPFHGGHSPSSP